MNAESNVSAVSWMHGLQDYFLFLGKHDIAQFCANYLKILYSENKATVLRNSVVEASQYKPLEDVINFYSYTINSQEDTFLKDISSALHKLFPSEELFEIMNKYYRNYLGVNNISDAFSRGQVNSKTWMVDELSKIQTNFKMIHIHAGWFGQHRLYFDAAGIEYDKIRVFDTDQTACEISDYVFNLNQIDDYKVKAAELVLPSRDSETHPDMVMTWLARSGVQYDVTNFKTGKSYTEKTMPDLIVNTSAEHMSSIWYHKFINRPMETDPLFVIQTNNLFDVPEHQLCVHTLDHMQKKFPMSRIEYAGEKELYGYKRFMMIGRP